MVESNCWKYGDFEFYFDENMKLESIFTDYVASKIDGCFHYSSILKRNLKNQATLLSPYPMEFIWDLIIQITAMKIKLIGQ